MEGMDRYNQVYSSFFKKDEYIIFSAYCSNYKYLAIKCDEELTKISEEEVSCNKCKKFYHIYDRLLTARNNYKNVKIIYDKNKERYTLRLSYKAKDFDRIEVLLDYLKEFGAIEEKKSNS